jgi:superoxide dismutase, Cu-Zn family
MAMLRFSVVVASMAALAATAGGCQSDTTTVVETGNDTGMNEMLTANEVMPGNMADGRMAAGAYRAVATLKTAEGSDVGMATVQQMGESLQATVEVHDMPQGMHGAHVHMTGACEAPDFTSAGGHWNPTGAQHGLENPQGAHAGDMPNLEVGANGSGTLTFMLPAGTYEQLMDEDGAAFVVHAGPDDLKTDPSGDSGARVACGVFEAPSNL